MTKETVNDTNSTDTGLEPSASSYQSGVKSSDWHSDSSGASGASATSTMSVIGPTLVIKGELEAGEDLLVEGRVEGSIKHTAERLLIGQPGTVKADVHARNVVVEGEVEGDIYGSESVSIKETAKVSGNIFTPKISIIEGAQFKGSIEMETKEVRKH